MDKEIYRLFTSENGVIISMPALAYLSEHIKDQAGLQAFFAAFKSKLNTSSIDMDQAMEIMVNKREEAVPYSVRTFRYTQRCYPDEFEHYKSLVNRDTVPISTLDTGVDSTIFGILYRNRLGAYVLEDDHDVIEVVFDSTATGAFVFENMFLGLSGAKIQKPENTPCDEAHSVFAVAEIVLPAFSARSSENSFLDKRKKKICIFGSYDSHKTFVESALERERPDIVIISAETQDPASELPQWRDRMICCSCSSGGSFLPSQQQYVSNPFVLDLADASIGFVDSEFFRNRQLGMFTKGNLIESFLRSVLSQSSLDPFSRSDMRLQEMPGFIVLAQKTYPAVLDVENVKFISLPPAGERAYAVLDFQTESFQVVCDRQ